MPIAVEIVTPTKVAHKSVAKEVRAPGFFGEFGVLPDHVPFLTVVEPGLVTITSDSGERSVFVVGEGFAEAGPDRLILLTASCEEAGGVDKAAARAALDVAEKELVSLDPNSGEWKTAERNAKLSRARLLA